jgi:hypothetical protein
MAKLDWEKTRDQNAITSQGTEYVPKEYFGSGNPRKESR